MDQATDFKKLVTVINRLLELGFDLQLPADSTEATVIRDLTVLADVIDPPESDPDPQEIGRAMAFDAAEMMLSRKPGRGRRRLSGRRGNPSPERSKMLAEVINGKRSIDDPSL